MQRSLQGRVRHARYTPCSAQRTGVHGRRRQALLPAAAQQSSTDPFHSWWCRRHPCPWLGSGASRAQPHGPLLRPFPAPISCQVSSAPRVASSYACRSMRSEHVDSTLPRWRLVMRGHVPGSNALRAAAPAASSSVVSPSTTRRRDVVCTRSMEGSPTWKVSQEALSSNWPSISSCPSGVRAAGVAARGCRRSAVGGCGRS